jgi:mRNA interferase RelE/StbE
MIVFYSKTAFSYLQKLDAKTRRRISEAISRIPGKGDIQRMKGRKIQNTFRLRVGSYRVIFLIEEEIIKVLDIAPRGEV